MSELSHTIRDEIQGIGAFIGTIWVVFLVSLVAPSINHYGLTPRQMDGLIGVVTMPFLHGNLQHIMSNTIPLVVLLFLTYETRANPWVVVALTTVLSGSLLWLFGRNATHIGASGLVTGLATFLILIGFLEKRVIPILIAILVGFLYGGSLVLGVIPRFGSNVSWDGHLCGAIAGAIVALALSVRPMTRPAARISSALAKRWLSRSGSRSSSA